MPEPYDVLRDLDQPRPLSAELRALLEERLLSDGLPVDLADAEAPRPLSPALRTALLAELTSTPPLWRRPGVLAGAAAAVAAAVGAALLLQPAEPPRTRVTAQPTAVLSRPPVEAGAPAAEPGATAGDPPLRGSVAAPKATSSSQPLQSGGTRNQGLSPAAPAAAGPPARDSAAPTVSSLAPSSGPFSGGTVVTLTGTGFTAGARVLFDGTQAVAVEVLSATTLRATTPAHLPGEVAVTVTTAAGTSNAVLYRYVT